MRIFTKLGLRSISLFVKTRMDTILPKMKRENEARKMKKSFLNIRMFFKFQFKLV